MGCTARAILAAVGALVGASCSVFTPLDGLSGAQGPGAGDATSGDVAAAADATAESQPPEDAPAEASVDAPPAAEAGLDAPPEAAPEAGPTGYAAAVLADAPLAYWRVGESAGSGTCHDASGHGNDATVVGGVTLGVPGALANDANTAARFDGPTGMLDVGDKFDFIGLAPASIEVWLKAEVIDNGYRHVETKMLYTDAGQPDDGMYIYIHAGQTLGFERWANNTTQNAAASGLTTNAWTHVVGTFDGTTLVLYVNGVLMQTGTTNIAMIANGIHLLWGQGFQGTLDELALYDHALSAARVKAHYQAAQ